MRNSRLVREAYFQSGLEKFADLFDAFAQTFRINCGQRVESIDKQLVCVRFHYVHVFESQIETSAWNHARWQHREFEFLKNEKPNLVIAYTVIKVNDLTYQLSIEK
jgi:hypothetical protein